MKAIDILRNEDLTRNFARALVTELGADARPIKDYWCWNDMLSHYGDLIPAVVEWFGKALTGKDAKVWEMAASTLGYIGDAKAIPILIKALKDDESITARWYAALALGEIGNAKAIPALIKALADDVVYVRREAAIALGKVGNVSAIPALIQALADDVAHVRWYAAYALGHIGAAKAIPALIQVLADDKNAEVRRAAALALKMIGDPKAIPALRKALWDEDEWVRVVVSWALHECNDEETK